MKKKKWAKVDRYFEKRLLGPDPILESVRKANRKAELPAIDVSPMQGKMLHLLAKMQPARRILEIGTLGGYSTIWLARALPPDGRLITLELEPFHAEVAGANIEQAGCSDLVEIKVGPALESLAQLEAEGAAPFDLIFIDADKESIPEYFAHALALSREGTVIIVDNVVRNGAVTDRKSGDTSVQGVRRFVKMLAKEERVAATVVQTVGSKGYDGFIMAVVGKTTREDAVPVLSIHEQS